MCHALHRNTDAQPNHAHARRALDLPQHQMPHNRRRDEGLPHPQSRRRCRHNVLQKDHHPPPRRPRRPGTTLGACNKVYVTPDGKLCGTNTDWRGIKCCLLNASASADDSQGRNALIMGAGGASRAAVYALSAQLGSKSIYVINRDRQEVMDLLQDAQGYEARPPSLVHVRSREQARGLNMPFYIVGTVPDLEPKMEDELEARGILEIFLSKEGEKGGLLDMCFKTRTTRILKLARTYGWRTVEGTEVIGHQIEEQWRLCAGVEAGKIVPKEGAWRILRKAARESPAINI